MTKMMKMIINWLDKQFGSFPDWSDLKHLDQTIGFKTRYGYISFSTYPPNGPSNMGEICFDPTGNTLFVNVSSDPYNPLWQKIY